MKKFGIQSDGADMVISVKKDSNDKIVSGLVLGDTLHQNQYFILKAQKGEYRFSPLLGAGIDDMTNDNEITEWKKRIRQELTRDGMTVDRVDINLTSKNVTIKADY